MIYNILLQCKLKINKKQVTSTNKTNVIPFRLWIDLEPFYKLWGIWKFENLFTLQGRIYLVSLCKMGSFFVCAGTSINLYETKCRTIKTSMQNANAKINSLLLFIYHNCRYFQSKHLLLLEEKKIKAVFLPTPMDVNHTTKTVVSLKDGRFGRKRGGSRCWPLK